MVERGPNSAAFFPIDEDVPGGLVEYLGVEPEQQYDSLLIEVGVKNPVLSQALGYCKKALGIPDELEEHFADGFLAAYKLFCLQATINRTQFPEINLASTNDLFAALTESGMSPYEYWDARINVLDEQDTFFVEAMDDCLDEADDSESYAFSFGAVMLYDILKHNFSAPAYWGY